MSNCLFHGRDLRYETEDKVICASCNNAITIEEEYAPTPEWTHGQFVVLARLHADMTQQAERRTEQILKRMKHRGWLKQVDEYAATVEYNGACHCHPEPKEFRLPVEWLFAENWEAKVDEYMQQLEAKRLAAEAETDKILQAQERKDYERLQKKFGA